MSESSRSNATAGARNRDRETIRGWVSKTVAAAIPVSVQTRGVSVAVRTPSPVKRDQPMEFEVTFRNWLPVPLSIATKARPWYWQIDGIHDADVTEPDPEALGNDTSNNGGTLTFSPFERKEITRIWNGRMRADPNGPLLPVECGEHILEIVVTTTAGSRLCSSQSFRVTDTDDQQHTNDD